MLLSQAQAKAACDKLLQAIRADDAQVSVGSSDFSHLRFAANDLTTSGRREDVYASITVWIDRKRGSASASSLDDDALRSAVQQAEELARIAPVDREYMQTLGPQKYQATAATRKRPRIFPYPIAARPSTRSSRIVRSRAWWGLDSTRPPSAPRPLPPSTALSTTVR